MGRLQLNRQIVDTGAFAPHDSLLSFLRDTRGLTGTKEGCGSGDCGACTVIVQPPVDANGQLPPPINLNSCITPLGAVLDCHVLTVEGVGQPDRLHPVQSAMITEHASQCGFCTPGFVMSLVANQLRSNSPDALADQTRSDAIEAISGNLCRCTGYRPILAAALESNQVVAAHPVELFTPTGTEPNAERSIATATPNQTSAEHPYHHPTNLQSLTELIGNTVQASDDSLSTIDVLLAGTTDAWLNVTQRYADLSTAIDLTRVPELRSIEKSDGGLIIGAAVTHTELLQFFEADIRCPAIVTTLQRFGSPQVRNRGTIGGNIANASPIADWPPLLLALEATLLLMNSKGATRTVALSDYYLDYRQTVLANDELIVSVTVPAATRWQALIAHKISKRIEDDISSTMGAVYLEHDNGTVNACRIAFGGVAATPVRFETIEAMLIGKSLTTAAINSACEALGHALNPISDVRASADYRRAASVAVLRKALEEFATGDQHTLTQGAHA